MTESHAIVNLARQRLDHGCSRHLSAQDAWNHLVLPLRLEDGCLICATTHGALGDADALLRGKLKTPFRFVLAELRPLEEFIADIYDFEGIDVDEAA